MNRMRRYLALARFDKPVGIFLLLWPTLAALWIAGNGQPDYKIVFIFIAGVVLMRAAGCIINDWADRNWDGYVTRTQNRPLATGVIPPLHAMYFFIGICVLAFTLVCFTNIKTILWSIAALGIAILYPFTKRFTHWPQAFLGIAFAFGIPMAFSAQGVDPTGNTWLLCLATLFWTLAYDTEYAMVDRMDDRKIGIRSTALLFGRHDRLMIGFFQVSTLVLWTYLGLRLHFGCGYYGGLFVAGILFVYQQKLMYKQYPPHCFRAFLNNQWVGASFFVGILLEFWGRRFL